MAKTAWIFSYKIKKGVSKDEFIEKPKRYTTKSFPKRTDLSPGSTMCKITHGLISFFGKAKKTQTTRRPQGKAAKQQKHSMHVFR